MTCLNPLNWIRAKGSQGRPPKKPKGEQQKNSKDDQPKDSKDEQSNDDSPTPDKKPKRSKNHIPDRGEPNTIAENSSGTTRKKYGPDRWVEKEWNKGHHDDRYPKVEQQDHIHDYKPNPYHPEGKPTRQDGRRPRPRDLHDLNML